MLNWVCAFSQHCHRVRNTDPELGGMAHACNLGPQEANVGRSQVPAQPGLHGETVFQILREGSWEMAQLAKHLLYKHEDLGSDPQHPCKKWVQGHIPVTLALGGRDRGP